MFGFPDEDWWPPPFNEDKWEDLTNFLFKYLGYLIDTWKMIMIWPLKKRHQLASWLDDHWLASGIRSFSPLEISEHQTPVPWGHCLPSQDLPIPTSLIHNQWLPQQPSVTRWEGELQKTWGHWQVSHALWDPIRTVYTSSHHQWQHLSSSLVSFYWSNLAEQEPTLVTKLDTAYEGIDSILDHLEYCGAYLVMIFWQLGWVLSCDELELQQPLTDWEFTGYLLEKHGIHINLLEFVTISWVWMTLKRG